MKVSQWMSQLEVSEYLLASLALLKFPLILLQTSLSLQWTTLPQVSLMHIRLLLGNVYSHYPLLSFSLTLTSFSSLFLCFSSPILCTLRPPAGTDYNDTSVMFRLQGEDDLTFEIIIPILNNDIVEPDENFTIAISSGSLPAAISLAPDVGIVIIQDDDLSPTATVVVPTVPTSVYFNTNL